MLETSIPGHKPLLLSYLVLDYNGTIACDGRLMAGKGAGKDQSQDI